MKKQTIWILGFSAVIVLLLAAIGVYSARSVAHIQKQQEFSETYDRHYILVSDENSLMMQSIVSYAQEEAKKSGVKLEWLNPASVSDYAPEDLMEIAVAEKADGIIVCRNNEDLSNMVAKGVANNIPVITILNDDTESGRVSFIGLNAYQMGEAYGNQVLKSLKAGNNRVTVLINSYAETVQSSLIYSQIIQTVEEGNPLMPGVRAMVSDETVNSAGAFEAEEAIRDLFVKGEGAPDILVCLDSVTTECAIQAVTDYNKVGSVAIIGYYASENALAAIPKGIVQATLAPNTREIGTQCIDAMNEYLELGHVSNYLPAGFDMVTAENARAYGES